MKHFEAQKQPLINTCTDLLALEDECCISRTFDDDRAEVDAEWVVHLLCILGVGHAYPNIAATILDALEPK